MCPSRCWRPGSRPRRPETPPLGRIVDRVWLAAGIDLAGYAEREPERARRRAVWLLASGQTLVWAGLYYSFAALLLSWEAEDGWARTSLTPGIMAAVLVAAAVSPLTGRLIDAGFGRWVLAGGAFGGALALAGLTLVRDAGSFVAVWALIGVAQGACLYIPCFAFITRTVGAEARGAITRVTLLAGLASTLAFPAGAGLSELLGWRGALLVFAAVVALVAAPLLHAGATLLEPVPEASPPVERRARDREALRAALRNPAFWLIALGFPMMGLNQGMLINHMVPLLSERGIAGALAVSIASTIGPMQVAGRILMLRLGHRVGAKGLAAISFAGVASASTLLLLSGASVALAFTAAAIQGAFYGMISVIQPVVTAESLGRTGFGAISGRLAMPYLASFAVAPHLGALLWNRGGYDLAIGAAIGFACVGLGCMAVLRAMARRAQ